MNLIKRTKLLYICPPLHSSPLLPNLQKLDKAPHFLSVFILKAVLFPGLSQNASYSKLTKASSIIVQILIYIILFSILISGYLISTADGQPISVFDWFEVPALFTGAATQADTAGEVHLYLAWAVVLLSVLHAFAAFKHHFFDRDITLKRMLGFNPDK